MAQHRRTGAEAKSAWWNLFTGGMAARLAKLAEKRTAAMNDGEPRYEQFRLIQEFVEALHRPGSA